MTTSGRVTIGYQGSPIDGLAFDAAQGVIPSDNGRVLSESGQPDPGAYVTGWIKRGPRGVVVEGGGEEQPLSVNLYVNFEFNSAELTSDARITLDQLGTALRDPKLAAFSFVIAGHTDGVGSPDFNQKLSERRAEAVRSYMINQYGIAANRLSAKGYGKSQLLDPDHPEDGVNRRVQVINATASTGQP